MNNLIAFVLLLVAAFGLPGVGRDAGPSPLPSSPASLNVQEPTKEMKEAVAKIAGVLKQASIADRLLWAQVWAKAGKAVAADSTDDKVVWSDTNSLRRFTETALRVGWRRLGDNAAGKYPGLSAAIEEAFAAILSKRLQTVTPELRKRYVELCNAIAWAGVGRDE